MFAVAVHLFWWLDVAIHTAGDVVLRNEIRPHGDGRAERPTGELPGGVGVFGIRGGAS